MLPFVRAQLQPCRTASARKRFRQGMLSAVPSLSENTRGFNRVRHRHFEISPHTPPAKVGGIMRSPKNQRTRPAMRDRRALRLLRRPPTKFPLTPARTSSSYAVGAEFISARRYGCLHPPASAFRQGMLQPCRTARPPCEFMSRLSSRTQSRRSLSGMAARHACQEAGICFSHSPPPASEFCTAT